MLEAAPFDLISHMSLAVIALPALIFLLCLFIHAALWRLKLPKSRPAALFFIFVIFPFLAGTLWAATGFLPDPGFSMGEWLAASLLQLAFASAYILTYPAFEALSPSLVIVLLAGERGGIDRIELSGFFSDEALFEPRLKDLLDSGLARSENGILTATFKGRLLAGFFIFMRAFLGLPKGGG